jgi:hypothetical protein
MVYSSSSLSETDRRHWRSLRFPLAGAETAWTETIGRVWPYCLSWAVLAALMVIGMERMPSALYRPVDGDWAKWNVEAILHFGKAFDLGPYSMLAGMGSMYFPNLPWLNPGALALGLPLDGRITSIVSYAVYAAELAVSIVALARVIGFSWLTATAGAQLYLYLLFPPFSEVFRIYDWYSLAPYYAHLQAALNGAAAVLLVCGRLADWQANALLALAFFALFVSGLISAPFTFVFATPAYIVICAALILTRRRPPAEWAWKATALAFCLIFFFASGLLDYYLGTIATAGRTPTAPVAWDRLLSAQSWLQLFRDHALCSDSRLLLCFGNRGAWQLIAALGGAALAIVTRRGDIRTAAAAFIGYIALAHVYAYAYQTISLGPLGVLSSHFLMLSVWSFTCIFAIVPFSQAFQPFGARAAANAGSPLRDELAFLGNVAFAALLFVIAVAMLRNPYGSEHYRPAQLAVGAVAVGALILAVAVLESCRAKRLALSVQAISKQGWRRTALLSAFPILALVHLSLGIREPTPPTRDPSLHNYLRENASIDVGMPFRGFAATIWLADKAIEGDATSAELSYYLKRFDETLQLWRANVPTLEEYGEWTSAQAHAFVMRLLAPPAGTSMHSNYLRAYAVDPDILRMLGVRYIVTNVETLDRPAVFRGAVTAPDTPGVYLFELGDANLGTYSPTRFVTAATADAIANRIRENRDRLDQVAVVSEDVPPTNAKARNVVMTVELDGVRIRAVSDGPAHLLLPVQFSHCLRVVNGSPARLTRANLIQTLVSFEGALDARLEFRFGLFADNTCRLRDGQDNKALGL